MTYKIVIPVYTNEHILDNCLKSIDVDWSHLIIVDNSKESFCKKYEGRGATIYYFPENIGCARAWNLGLKAGADWTFIVGISAVFPNGFSEILLDIHKGSQYALITDLSYHCNAISKKLVEKIGFFDENFYPAYYEDTDFQRRMHLAGVDEPNIVIPAYSTMMANSVTSKEGLPVHYQHLQDYYKEKWGGIPGEETFKTPFGKPENDLKYWKGEALSTLQIRYELNALKIN